MKKSKSSFRDKVTKDAHRQQKAGTSYGHLLLPRNVNVFNPDPSQKVKLDFLPYNVTDGKHPDRNDKEGVAIPESLWYKRPYKLHRNIGANDESIICPTSIGKPCPICEYRKKRIRENADKKETDALKASDRVLYVVIPLDSPKHEAKVSVFDFSWWNFQKLLNEELEDNADNGVFPELEGGLTLQIRFTSKTIADSKPFPEASKITFLPRKEDYDESIMEEVPNLDEMFQILSYDELRDKFFAEEDGGKLEDVEDEDEEEKPPKHSHKKPSKVKEEEDEDEDEDEEEEEKPPLKPRSKSKPKEEEDDDEDNDDEDEEEEKKPPMRRNSGTNKESKKLKCPHGHKFGVDAEDFEECDTCDLWSECVEAKENG